VKRFDALLIDFDGVLRRWPDDDGELEAAHGLPPGSLRRVAFAPDLIEPAVLGRISDEQWRERIAQDLQRAHPDSEAAQAVARWSAAAGELDREVLALLDRCWPELRLVLVSNATSRLPRDLQALGLAQRFHAVINSSELGHAKPDSYCLRAALAYAGVEAGHALFVDDDAANVAAAVALGAHGHHYRDPAGLRQWLEQAEALCASAQAPIWQAEERPASNDADERAQRRR